MVSEGTFQYLVNRLPHPVMGVDSDGVIFYGNDELAVVLGAEPARLNGERAERFFPDAAWMEPPGESVQPEPLVVGGSPWAAVQRMVPEGRFFILIPEQEDLSELQCEESRDGKWDLGAVLGSLYDDILITDQRGRILKVSGDFELIYGKRQGDLVGKTVQQLEREGVFNPSITKQVLRERTKQTGVQETRGGRRVLVTGVPVFDREGNFTRVICYSRDITEPMRLKEHLGLVEQELVRIKTELKTLRQAKLDTGGMVAVNERMKHTLETAVRVAQVDVNVLLQGESGVGKTAIARYIHKQGPRADGPFIEVNCGAIPDALFESEVFGYEGGAFTGAQRKGKVGLAEMAEGGTLFLDEVGELSPSAQVKVLKLIQEKQFYRVGGTRPIQADIRLIAATNHNLEELVRQGSFREDLFFRLNVVPVTVPPLRERKEDILTLVQTMMEKYRKKHRLEKVLDLKVKERLVEYGWPGNVRELENLLERLLVTSRETVIRLEDLPPEVKPAKKALSLQLDGSLTLSQILDRVERDLLLQARDKYGSTTKMAEALGISQSTVVRKLKKHRF